MIQRSPRKSHIQEIQEIFKSGEQALGHIQAWGQALGQVTPPPPHREWLKNSHKKMVGVFGVSPLVFITTYTKILHHLYRCQSCLFCCSGSVFPKIKFVGNGKLKCILYRRRSSVTHELYRSDNFCPKNQHTETFPFLIPYTGVLWSSYHAAVLDHLVTFWRRLQIHGWTGQCSPLAPSVRFLPYLHSLSD